jgi:hypothetical protein
MQEIYGFWRRKNKKNVSKSVKDNKNFAKKRFFYTFAAK